MFSVRSLTIAANSAISSIASAAKREVHALGCHQRHVLRDQRAAGLGEDTHELGLTQGFELDADGKPSLELRNEVRWLGHVERAGSDEEDVIRSHHAVFGVDGCALHDRKNVALNAFATDVRSVAAFAACNLVDFVEKDDAGLLHSLDGESSSPAPCR